jgi:hypothetical protein
MTDKTRAADAGLTLKDFMVVIPLLGSAWAMSFSVGLFSAFGMSYIMMFSLSEHITAAIPSASLALLFASLIFIAVYTSHWRAKWALTTVGIVVVLALAFGCHWAWHTFNQRELWLIAVVVLLLTAGVVWLLKSASQHPAPVFAGLSLGAAVVAFLLGHISGSATMASTQTPWKIVPKESPELNGSLLYAGEKAVLLVVPSRKRTHYVRMETIKELSRESPSPTH